MIWGGAPSQHIIAESATVGGSTAITAALAATPADLTLSGTAAPIVAASLADTIADLTLSGTAAPIVAASLAGTIADLTLSGTAAPIIGAILAETLADLTLNGSGNPVGGTITASLGAALADLTLGGSGSIVSAHLITPIGVGTAAMHARLTTAGYGLDTLVDPGDSNPPIILEPPPALSGGDLEVWIIASGGAGWGGCQVWISTDNATYALAGTIYRGGRQGTLIVALPSHADPDTSDTLSVDLTESQGQLLSGTTADADNYVTLCYCDGELVSYQSATLTSAYHYNLTYLRRGVYGTPIGAHSSGSDFARFGPNDPSLLRYRYPASFIGQTVYVKLPAFNDFGQALQDLSGLTPTSFALTGNGAAAAPAYVSGSWAGSPAASQVIERYIFATPVTFPAGLAGSYGSAGTAATGAASFAIAKNGTNVGTMGFAASATTAAFTMASATSFAGGDVLTIVAPATPDATLANLAWTLSGSR